MQEQLILGNQPKSINKFAIQIYRNKLKQHMRIKHVSFSTDQ